MPSTAQKEITVSVSNLHFDPLNPRLPSTKSGSNEAIVLAYMLDKGTVTDIMLSIAENGFYSQEPLLVVPSAHGKDQYDVVEGNRRLAALKLLLNPDLAPTKKGAVKQIADEATNKPEEVPVLKYESRDDILLYLGYRHITGVHEWDSLAKARYLFQLKNDKFKHLGYLDALKAMAKTIGSRSDYVHRLLSGFILYQKIEQANFFNIPGLNEESFSFSLLTTATSYKNIADFIGVNANVINDGGPLEIKDKNLKELTEWMFKENAEGYTRLGESRNLKSLNAVVAHDAAIKIFRDGRSLKEAEIFTDAPAQTFESALTIAAESLRDAWITLPSIEITYPYHLDKLKDMNTLIRNIFNTVTVKLVKDGLEDLQ
ncbi:hypothetical protein EXU85_00500 [Spirosoma sp. KCTC 42546]|uniref:ParB N-terminal domain-containing protein n=1 Tax=Spirosoma sp. KCTC 42546 TaxID=2520506 RepID=UPI0011585D98|nr:ParB N-terminal domain-containing protein [Spirosoma sp. KCTC 42546]QDK77153.1 hypothetical protein EXU85_00500 [Spirosoma sp. KCTC 42546]